MIKKAALSLLVIGASGAYVWTQSTTPSSDNLAEASPLATTASPDAVAAVAVEPPLIVREPPSGSNDVVTAPRNSVAPVRVQSVAIDPGDSARGLTNEESAESEEPAAQSDTAPVHPQPASPQRAIAVVELPRLRPALDAAVRPINASAKVATKSHRGLADGTFDGPAVDAFYGYVQIEANVQNGKLVNIRILRYPSDRRTSVAINRQALPILKREAIAAQSARIDVVSGATLSSEAFIESLGAALRQASA